MKNIRKPPKEEFTKMNVNDFSEAEEFFKKLPKEEAGKWDIYNAKYDFFIRVVKTVIKETTITNVIPVINDTNKEFGEHGGVYEKKEKDIHRDLGVQQGISKFPRGEIAHIMTSILNLIVGRIDSEILIGYDRIIFAIREGYIPVSRKVNYNSLEQELASYLNDRKMNNITDGSKTVKMEYNPQKAKKYWEKLQNLAKS